MEWGKSKAFLLFSNAGLPTGFEVKEGTERLTCPTIHPWGKQPSSNIASDAIILGGIGAGSADCVLWPSWVPGLGQCGGDANWGAAKHGTFSSLRDGAEANALLGLTVTAGGTHTNLHQIPGSLPGPQQGCILTAQVCTRCCQPSPHTPHRLLPLHSSLGCTRGLGAGGCCGGLDSECPQHVGAKPPKNVQSWLGSQDCSPSELLAALNQFGHF